MIYVRLAHVDEDGNDQLLGEVKITPSRWREFRGGLADFLVEFSSEGGFEDFHQVDHLECWRRVRLNGYPTAEGHKVWELLAVALAVAVGKRRMAQLLQLGEWFPKRIRPNATEL